jgi:uncharacterized protein YndB with AHSA1/START domain
MRSMASLRTAGDQPWRTGDMSARSGGMGQLVVQIHRFLAASPEVVFAAWTDPQMLARWISPIGHALAEVEPWPGGRLNVTMVGAGREIVHTGVYREVIPGRRLVFTWLSPYTGPGESVVTVELRARDGGTQLTLTHEGLMPDAVESHAGGWGQILDRLGVEVVRRAPSSRPGEVVG